ncbi:MAG: hypothetical protein LBJ11_06530 [Oscillospiraceae bacterium]|nr:hypothetical protein [Oscillospiraceae bacterium]
MAKPMGKRRKDRAAGNGTPQAWGAEGEVPKDAAAVTARQRQRVFPALTGGQAPLGAGRLFGGGAGMEREECWYPGAEGRLYRSLREAVPIIDAAIFRLVRLAGGFEVRCGDEEAQARLRGALETIPVGGNQWGIHAFVASYFEQLLTMGTALGELVLREDGSPAALWNVPLEGITLRRAANGLDAAVCTGADGETPAPCPELVFLSVLHPEPGALTGNSLLKGLPFVSSVLIGGGCEHPGDRGGRADAGQLSADAAADGADRREDGTAAVPAGADVEFHRADELPAGGPAHQRARTLPPGADAGDPADLPDDAAAVGLRERVRGDLGRHHAGGRSGAEPGGAVSGTGGNDAGERRKGRWTFGNRRRLTGKSADRRIRGRTGEPQRRRRTRRRRRSCG